MTSVKSVMNFHPTNADAAVPFVIGEQRGLSQVLRGTRDGVPMRLTNTQANTQLQDAACWNFVLNGGRDALPDGLKQAGDIIDDMLDPVDREERMVAGTNRCDFIPKRCQPERVVATRDIGSLRAGTQLITLSRQQALTNGYARALRDPLRGRTVTCQRENGSAYEILIIHPTEHQQAFHHLLIKTVVQLYGFVTIAQERAEAIHNMTGRRWLSISVRSSAWWGWDHWAFKGSFVNGLRTTTSRYAQKTPHEKAHVGGASLWDELLNETCIDISQMPERVFNQLRVLRAA